MKVDYLQDFEEVCRRIYPKKLRLKSLSGIENVLELVRRNRMHTALSLETSTDAKEIKVWRDEYKVYRREMSLVLGKLARAEKVGNWSLIKTLSSYPHLTHDLDVVVTSEIGVDGLKEKIKEIESGLEIDLHERVSWTDSPEVSQEFFWKHQELRKIGGVEVQVPDAALDAIIRIAHLPFEVGCIRFGELLHVYRQLSRVDIEEMAREAERCGWRQTYLRMMRILMQLHERLFGETLGGEKAIFRGGQINFPYNLPFSLLARAVVEKRAWKKIWGARYILFERLGIPLSLVFYFTHAGDFSLRSK